MSVASRKVAVGLTEVLLVDDATLPGGGSMLISTPGQIEVGATGLTAGVGGTGFAIAASGSLSGDVASDDKIYGIAQTTTVTVSIFRMGNKH